MNYIRYYILVLFACFIAHTAWCMEEYSEEERQATLDQIVKSLESKTPLQAKYMRFNDLKAEIKLIEGSLTDLSLQRKNPKHLNTWLKKHPNETEEDFYASLDRKERILKNRIAEYRTTKNEIAREILESSPITFKEKKKGKK